MIIMKVTIKVLMANLGRVVSERSQDIKEGSIVEPMVRCTSAVRPSG